MENRFAGLPKEEQVTLTLRQLFAQRGYRRYRMSSFEGYDMYLANKSFLKSGGIITFTDGTGRLLALKPDVTMSIVKNTKETEAENKLYYIESVFRTAQHGKDIREISQMGVEYIGAEGAYAEAEVVRLACESLAAISADAVLNVSHMGFVTGLLEALGFAPEGCGAVLEALRAKNAHALRGLAAEAGCGAGGAEQLAQLAALCGPFAETFARAKALVCAPAMQQALDDLAALYDTLCAADAADVAAMLRLDFSVLNDIDYYNGLVLQGYVRGVPHAVLAGGRYDNLMRRFGKPQAAMGFALYLGELGRAFARRGEHDVEVLLLYTAQQPPALVAKAVQRLSAQGRGVCAAQHAPAGLRAAETLRLCNDGTTEVASC